ncbi:hypothetical protein BXZ70DRAFT_925991 [Cristinia sonorae]|uniref:F-box domain-containing protein n=1 Tax=Cristinia sonorae TaxID=1940300 RepID=A0A8K0UVE3_9AGAR|nr:hypothetical protein BXZ70DRAFT_925991 [Cristinia sonorae]
MCTPIHTRDASDVPRDRMSLHSLPYDLLLNVALNLSLHDILALQMTCRSLHEFGMTRPVFRNLAVALLRRCRALPLSGFQRLSDLTNEQLIHAVTRATRLERAWLTGTPKPSTQSPYTDSPDQDPATKSWYKVITSPPGEEIDWLSPITSSYSLCATKSGKVVCWDVYRDVCLAEWNPNERWELWKCRVEFDIRTVYFSMAKTISKSGEDRTMEFILMKLEFPNTPLDSAGRPSAAPVFSRLATFRTMGVVMNVFLLDPAVRLLSAFVWVPSSNTIGLYALLDWNKPQYIYVDTGIECTMSSNWSCILHEDQIVIHSEESDIAYQYFYPIQTLRKYSQPSKSTGLWGPTLSARLTPITTLKGRFIFPSKPFPRPTTTHTVNLNGANITVAFTTVQAAINGNPVPALTIGAAPAPIAANANPFPFPPWYPESAHFVRQWWPTLPTIPRLSCTVVLLANHDPLTHRTQYVLAQHYFRVPLSRHEFNEVPITNNHAPENGNGAFSSASSSHSSDDVGSEHCTAPSANDVEDDDLDADLLRIWYVSTPFEVVCVFDGVEDDAEEGQAVERPRPLMAVDFGHAVWVEYCDDDPPPPPIVQFVELNGVEHVQITAAPGNGHGPAPPAQANGNGGAPAAAAGGAGGEHQPEPHEPKRLRFVTFPPVVSAGDEDLPSSVRGQNGKREVEGTVRTLEIPEELDLDTVETINIDQSQGAVIISVKEGKIFILCYE